MSEAQATMADTTETRKFLFDFSFDNEISRGRSEREKPKPTFSQEQLDAAAKEAYDKGAQDGQKTAMENQQRQMNVLVADFTAKLVCLMESNASQWQSQLTQIQDIALVIARKVLPSYVTKNGLGEIEAVVSKIISEMSREPRLVFRVNEQQFDVMNERINAVAKDTAYAGKIVILGDAALGPSDCRIEWADGGIERDVQTLWQNIDRVMGEVQTGEPDVLPTPADIPLEPTPPKTDLGDAS